MSIIYILQGVSAAPETDFLGMFKSVQTVSRFYSFDERLTVLGGMNQINAGLVEDDKVL